MAKILIIEDEEPLTRVLKDHLEEEKYEVLIAKNGEDGLDLAKTEHPDLIILDIVMPKMNGQEVLKNLRKDSWGKKANVIFATNVGTVEAINESMASGVTDYFIKSETSLEDIVKIAKSKLK